MLANILVDLPLHFCTWHVPKRPYLSEITVNCRKQPLCLDYFFLPPLSPSSLRSHEITLPSITTPLPSMKATRDKPSQFLNVSQTSGCCGWKLHWAISLDFNECGSSIFLPPVSLPIFHLSFEMRQAERPHRTNPIGE